MANPAFHRPDMPGLQPVAETKVNNTPALRPEPLLRVSDGEMPDRIFKYAMVACGMAVLGLLALIILLRPGRAAAGSRRTADASPPAQLPERIWLVGVGVLFGGGGVWLLYRASETRYSLDLLFGLISTIFAGFCLLSVATGRWKKV